MEDREIIIITAVLMATKTVMTEMTARIITSVREITIIITITQMTEIPEELTTNRRIIRIIREVTAKKRERIPTSV